MPPVGVALRLPIHLFGPVTHVSDEYGHVKISRKAYDSDPFWLEKREFSRWEAWEWLIQAAAWKEHERALKQSMGVVRIARGETPPLSVRYLGEAWGWGKNKVSRFLELLGAGQMCRIRDSQRTSDGDTYIIVNYDTYQKTWDTSRDSQRDRSGTGPGHRRSNKANNNLSPYGGERYARTHESGERVEAMPRDVEPYG